MYSLNFDEHSLESDGSLQQRRRRWISNNRYETYCFSERLANYLKN